MISARWSTENHRRLAPRSARATEKQAARPKLLERPDVMLGIAVGVGVAIGLLVKWGWRQ